MLMIQLSFQTLHQSDGSNALSSYLAPFQRAEGVMSCRTHETIAGAESLQAHQLQVQ